MTNTALSTHPKRAMLVRLSILAWAALVSAIALANLINLHVLTLRSDASVSVTKVSALERRLTELSQQVEEEREQPPALPQARFDAAQKALAQRLASIEQTLGERLTANDLAPLRERLEKIEARPADPRQRTAPSPARSQGVATGKKPKAVSLPFTVIGLELRGDESFLSISSNGPTTSGAITVLHPGETEAGWQLDAIEGRTAVLRNGAQVRRVNVP